MLNSFAFGGGDNTLLPCEIEELKARFEAMRREGGAWFPWRLSIAPNRAEDGRSIIYGRFARIDTWLETGPWFSIKRKDQSLILRAGESNDDGEPSEHALSSVQEALDDFRRHATVLTGTAADEETPAEGLAFSEMQDFKDEFNQWIGTEDETPGLNPAEMGRDLTCPDKAAVFIELQSWLVQGPVFRVDRSAGHLHLLDFLHLSPTGGPRRFQCFDVYEAALIVKAIYAFEKNGMDPLTVSPAAANDQTSLAAE